MICPYNRKSLRQAIQTSNELDESGSTKSTNQVTIEEYILMECPKEECGAWQNDKCNFNQGTNY